MKTLSISLIAILGTLFMFGCFPPRPPTADQIDQAKQEVLLKEGVAQAGMPSITRFFEKKMLKLILELRDNSGLVTYTYTFSEQTGLKTFFCDSIGYGIPYATQYTNPQKIAYSSVNVGVVTLPQADPNGLFSPASADGTWVLCKIPGTDKVEPQYCEPKVITLTFKPHTADYIYPKVVDDGASAESAPSK